MKLIRWCAWAAKNCSNNWLCFDRPRDSQGLGIARRTSVAKTGNDWPEMRSLNSPLRWGSSISNSLGSSNYMIVVTVSMVCVASREEAVAILRGYSMGPSVYYVSMKCMLARISYQTNNDYVRHLNYLAVLHVQWADRILVRVLWAPAPVIYMQTRSTIAIHVG